ncbi:MAG: arylsulfatase [Bacteroidota bacterium]
MMSFKPQALFPLLIILIACSCTSKEDLIPQKPNIIIILTDDQGYGDLGIHGNEHIQTPNLDRIGAESIRLTNFHSATTCSPTRAGLLSGMHCNRVGAWHTVMGRSFLSTAYPTLAQYLESEGYTSGIFGKWHLGDNYPFRPQDRGFDETFIHGGGGVGQIPDMWNNDSFRDTYFENGKIKRTIGYVTKVWTDAAIAFIEQAKTSEQPFFCYLSTNAPHGPHQVPQKYIDRYADNEAVAHAPFYAQITALDEHVGRLDSTLTANSLRDNTILIFLTDNGTARGVDLDPSGQITKGFGAGMRGKKGSEYEGGHRVPFFIRFPDAMGMKPTTYDALTSHLDVVPTLLDIVGVDPGSATFDGTSIKDLLLTGNSANLDDRKLVADTQRQARLEKWKNTSVMMRHWRLVNDQELYDVSVDPSQQNNIIDQHQELARELSAFYETWWEDIAKDSAEVNRIIIGTTKERPTLLTSHDWWTEGAPPWHQNHVREARVQTGYWPLEVDHDGRYIIRWFRWHPRTPRALLSSEVPAGRKVPGAAPYPAGVAIQPDFGIVKIQGQEIRMDKAVNGRFYEAEVDLNQGFTTLEAMITDQEGVERGAYYVEVDHF